MPYEIEVLARPSREEALRLALSVPHESEQIFFRGSKQRLPRVQINIQLPTYRLANGRTQTGQIKLTRDRGNLPPDFFTIGQENQSAQVEQHRLLTALASDAKADIRAELRDRRIQTEALIVTANGMVVNGNRRLAAMRELWASDPTAYSAFERVDVVVLPADTNDQEIERLETYLQEARPTKLDYDWVNRGLKLRRQVNEFGITRQVLVADYRFANEAEFNSELAMIDLVDEYLAHFGSAQQYELVRNHEQAFRDLRRNLESKVTRDLTREAKLMMFTLIRHSDAVEGRTHDYRKASGSHLQRVLDRLADERDIDLGQSAEPPEQSDDLFDMLDDGAPNRYEPLREVLSAENSTADLAREIAEHLEAIVEEERDDDRQGRALRDLRAIKNKLSKISAASVSQAAINDAVGELRLIQSLAEALRMSLELR